MNAHDDTRSFAEFSTMLCFGPSAYEPWFDLVAILDAGRPNVVYSRQQTRQRQNARHRRLERILLRRFRSLP